MKSKNNKMVQDGSSNGITAGMTAEYVQWLPIKELHRHKISPEFFREKLSELPDRVEHFISDERTG